MNFLKDYQNLIKQSPAMPRMGLRNEEADYTDYIYRSRNIYFSFTGGTHLDCAYLYNCWKCTDCVELSYCRECELCLECTDCLKCYGSSFLGNCQNLVDSHFCSECRSSSNLFGCAGLKLKKYCIFNQQFSKKEYKKRLKKLEREPVEKHLLRLEQLKKKCPARASHQLRTENCDFGDYVINSANCYWCFDTTSCKDSVYLTKADFSNDCLDCHDIYKGELLWECHNLGHSYNCSHVNSGDHLYDCHFCTCCYRSKNLFGCVNLYSAQYCILNRQYKKDEYFAKIRQIKKELGWNPIKPGGIRGKS